MRNLTVFLLLGVIGPPVFSDQLPPPAPVTVAQLVQLLSASHDLSDKPLARAIANRKLTERLSHAGEARLAKALPGKESRLALLAIADESAFLGPPSSEIPALPPPSAADQTALIHKFVAYAAHAMHELPNFIAKRNTVWFLGTPDAVPPALHGALFASARMPPHGDDRLATTGSTRSTVFYRNGREAFASWWYRDQECAHQLGSNFSGEFGELLGRVASAVTHGTVAWSHWEQSPSGPLAVFSWRTDLIYQYPDFCPAQSNNQPLHIHARGEIALNPADGSALRVAEMWRYQAAVAPAWPLFTQETDTAIDYGPQALGGKIYLCPQRSVSVVAYPWIGALPDIERLERRFGLAPGLAADPLVEAVDDITFTGYHVFHATVRILPAGHAGPPASAPPQR